MSHYSHLTQAERYQISSLLKANCSRTEIANILNRHKCTIGREIKRNTGKRGYRPKQADSLAIDRKSNNGHKITDFCWAYVSHLIKKKYSPEQVSCRLKLDGWDKVPSIERIYQFIYTAAREGGTALREHLRCQKQRRKRYGSGQNRRGKIVNRIDIDKRPELANMRARLGDFEGDTVVGNKHKGVLVTLVDRKSLELKMKPLPRKLATEVSNACIDKLKNELTHTLTLDNGLEFAKHEDITRAIGIEVYFAKPYCSWERGTNENTNGLIRQFFPKSMRLDQLTDEKVQVVEDNLNNRPRKKLGFLTPLEVKSRDWSVALQY
jgi:IS30 family transposase